MRTFVGACESPATAVIPARLVPIRKASPHERPIRVGQRAGSVAGRFRLDVFAPVPPPRPPGSALRARGVSRTLDSLQDTSDAWSFGMRAGTTYRVNLAAGPCMSLLVYAPGTQDFASEAPVARAGRGGYLLSTPAAGEGGAIGAFPVASVRRGLAWRSPSVTSPWLPLRADSATLSFQSRGHR